MARFIIYSFFFIVLINAFSINEVQATTKTRHRREDIGGWFNRQKESWFNWGNDKLDELKKAAKAAPLELEKRYEEIKHELAEKTAELESLPLFQDIERLELALLSDEAGVQHLKDPTHRQQRDVGEWFNSAKSLFGSGDDEIDDIQGKAYETASDRLEKIYEELENVLAEKVEELKSLPLWRDIQKLKNEVALYEAAIQQPNHPRVARNVGNWIDKTKKNLGNKELDVLSNELAEKLKQLESLPLWQDIRWLESAILADVASAEH